VSTRSAQRPAGAPPVGPLTAGSLCSGYGGLDLAVMAVTGARLAWCAEIDRYAVGVLAHRWPGVPNLGDVTALNWATVPPVDLVSAGWPCQDISYAGPGAGIAEHAVEYGCTSPPAFATFDPATSTWRTSPRPAHEASRKSSATWPRLFPRSGMTHSGRAFARPTPEPRTAATAFSSSPSGPAQPQGSRLLPTPVAGNFNDGASLQTWQARRDRQKKFGRNGNCVGTPLPVAIALLPTDGAPERSPQVGGKRPSGAKRQTGLPEVIIHRLASQGGQAGAAEPGEGRLLPTPDTGCWPNGHGRRGGRPGNGHQSGHGLDVAATALSAAPASRASQSTVAWEEYEPAIRRREGVLRYPAPPPAEPGPSGRPRLSAAFAEWMMGLAPGFVTAVPAIPRTRQLKRPCARPGGPGRVRRPRSAPRFRPAVKPEPACWRLCARPDLTRHAESSVDASGPGRKANRTGRSARKTAFVARCGRSAPPAAARDPRRPHPAAGGRGGGQRPW